MVELKEAVRWAITEPLSKALGVAHDPLTCARDATVELPKNSFMFAPAFAGRIRNGSIALTFNQKTNKVVLTFNRQKLSDVLNK